MHTLCEQLHATNMVRLLCVCVCVSLCVFESRGLLECRGAASAVNADVLWCKEDLSSKEKNAFFCSFLVTVNLFPDRLSFWWSEHVLDIIAIYLYIQGEMFEYVVHVMGELSAFICIDPYRDCAARRQLFHPEIFDFATAV